MQIATYPAIWNNLFKCSSLSQVQRTAARELNLQHSTRESKIQVPNRKWASEAYGCLVSCARVDLFSCQLSHNPPIIWKRIVSSTWAFSLIRLLQERVSSQPSFPEFCMKPRFHFTPSNCLGAIQYGHFQSRISGISSPRSAM
jgi:hypothetical protein